MIRTAAILFRKDVLVEVRTLQSLTAMVLFSVMAFVLFHFGLDRDTIAGSLAAGVLWVTLLLATVLAVTRLFVAEREQGGFETLLLAPIDRTAVFLGKAAALFTFLVAVEIVALPAFDILLLRGTIVDGMPELLAVLVLADLGLAAVGALVAALGAETDARELVVPLLLMPLLVPVVIGAAKASAPLLADPAHTEHLGRWLLLLTFYDLAFVLVSLGVFDYLLED
ncbi:MAG TPA: heme exporter protein CcmB [Thermoleophilaceae bacterium]|jgi:heme exporter protein B|nr:heme exporter protein CcmB [Thermoleophilaceae bacterium]